LQHQAVQDAGALLVRRSLLDAAEYLLDNKCGLSVVAYGDAVKALLLEKAQEEVRHDDKMHHYS
jgi:hypothetical protein